MAHTSSRRGVTLMGLVLVCLLVLYQLSTGTQCVSSGMTTLLSTESLMLQSAMSSGASSSLSNTTTVTATDSSTTPNTDTDSTEASSQRTIHKRRQRHIPLTELVATNEILECQRKRFQRVSDVVLNAALAYANDDDETDSDTDNYNRNHTDTGQPQQQQRRPQRKIPRIVHTTSKSRCMPSAFIDNLRPWQNLDHHSFFFHDDDAVDRLLELDWPEFPQLRKALKCSISGAAKADLWRALVLWEYGGIYTDVDNAVNAFNATTIGATDDAFFVVETMGIPSQFFFAASPRHPLVYLLITAIMHRLYDLPDFHNQYVPYVTGPGALKIAFQHFVKAHPPHVPPGAVRLPEQRSSYNKVPAGIYAGLGNRTVTVVGTKKRPDAIIHRNAVGNKQQLFRDMGMPHFSKVKRKATNESCWRQLYETEDAALTETVTALSRPLW
jgi:mannosyltransferase OCH1-like enzyme